MIALTFIAFVLLAIVAFALWVRWLWAARAEYIRTFDFPPAVFDKLSQKHTHLDQKDRQLVAQGLRQFFLAYLQGGHRFVSMPSQVADDLWHEFILFTRNYSQFCSNAFGRFLHHTPTTALGRNRQSNEGLRRVWWQCCKQEHLDPRNALRLPLLFALDRKLEIAAGFYYAVSCHALRERDPSGGNVHCGGDMSSSSVDGTTDGFGEGDGSGADGGCGGSGDGSGCGGGGCGGGGD